jgi:hypothetical protein
MDPNGSSPHGPWLLSVTRTPFLRFRLPRMESAMFKRRRFKQQLTLQDRLSAWVKQVRQQASNLPPGPERDALLKKARQADVANHLHDWVKSPGLQPPK